MAYLFLIAESTRFGALVLVTAISTILPHDLWFLGFPYTGTLFDFPVYVLICMPKKYI